MNIIELRREEGLLWKYRLFWSSLYSISCMASRGKRQFISPSCSSTLLPHPSPTCPRQDVSRKLCAGQLSGCKRVLCYKNKCCPFAVRRMENSWTISKMNMIHHWDASLKTAEHFCLNWTGKAINGLCIANKAKTGFSPLASCGSQLILVMLAGAFMSFMLIPSGHVSISQSHLSLWA